MKFLQIKISYFSILFFSILFFNASCNQNNSVIPEPSIEEGVVTFKVDGKEFYFPSTESEISSQTFRLFAVSAVFQGLNPFRFSFTIPINSSIDDKTYKYEGAECNQTICGKMEIGSYTSEGDNGWCEINFSSVDFRKGGYVRGSFSGVVVEWPLLGSQTEQEKIEITEGTFNLLIL